LGYQVEFIRGEMHELPAGKFDYVLLLSAIHYIEQPAVLLDRVKRVLSPGGTLVLELGLWRGGFGKTVGRALRSIDERFFASEELLRSVWLRDFTVREIGAS